jgi:hypothetical protein
MGVEVTEPPRRDFSEVLYEVIFVMNPQDGFEFRQMHENLMKQSNLDGREKLVRLGVVKADAFTYGDMTIPVADLQQAYFQNWGDTLGLS